MARSAKTPPPTKKPAGPARKPGRPKTVPVKTSAKAIKAPAAAAGRAAASPVTTKPSKDELRALVAKLEAANATLRSKNREANRATKTDAARIAELEDQVSRLEKQAAPPPPAPPGTSSPKPAAPVRGKRQRRGIDPGDAVPPGVAVEEAVPLDEEAERTREALEKTLKAD